MTSALPNTSSLSEAEYKRRTWAWTMYDWANSAFATTILAAVLPVYFSQVAGATLPSPTVATAYWSAGLTISLVIVALIAPILGVVSDIVRGKKRFLAIFAGLGVLSTAMLVFVGTGDWVLASIFGILGRIGFNGSLTFYDSLLPHVARPEDQDAVSARGYAMGYLGGGLLLAVNIVMIQLLPGTWGPRLSFLSVAVWWAVFTIPVLRRVPEPPAAGVALAPGENVVTAGFKRLRETLQQVRRYSQLFKFLIAFVIYNDGIGTIIGVAAIYGAEMGFGAVELILALLLVQFVAIPYALMFGRLPNPQEKRRAFFLAFIVLNMIFLPLSGVAGARLLPASISGARSAPFASLPGFAGEGLYSVQASELAFSGAWQPQTIPANLLDRAEESIEQVSLAPGAAYEFGFNGQAVRISYSIGPDYGVWQTFIDGQPAIDPDTLKPVQIDAYNPTVRYEETITLRADAPGQHTLRIQNSATPNPASAGTRLAVYGLQVLPSGRASNLAAVIGLVVGLEVLLLGLAWLIQGLFRGLAKGFDAKTGVLLGLMIYGVIAVWGFFIDSVIEFWFLAWMVAVVQGGSQALSRSIYSTMSPASKSGEFFGFFGIVEKFSTIIGPVLFASAGLIFGSSRPAVLSLILFFIIGGLILKRVDVDEGRRVAQAEDAQAMEAAV